MWPPECLPHTGYSPLHGCPQQCSKTIFNKLFMGKTVVWIVHSQPERKALDSSLEGGAAAMGNLWGERPLRFSCREFCLKRHFWPAFYRNQRCVSLHLFHMSNMRTCFFLSPLQRNTCRDPAIHIWIKKLFLNLMQWRNSTYRRSSLWSYLRSSSRRWTRCVCGGFIQHTLLC